MKKKVKEKIMDHKEHLISWLQDPEMQVAYLNAAIQEQDIELFLLALKDVIEARTGSLGVVAKKTKLSRPNLYRALSKDGNPRIKTVIKLLSSAGLNWYVGSSNARIK